MYFTFKHAYFLVLDVSLQGSVKNLMDFRNAQYSDSVKNRLFCEITRDQLFIRA